MPASFTLEPRLTVETATLLRAELRGRPGAVLDASGVRHLGAAALQVLLAARAEMGAALVLRDPSDAMREALAATGAESLLEGGAA
jgi:anti-anti-sigma regulatory factor